MRLAVLAASVAGFGLATWTIASALPTFSVDVSSPPRSFSPNGDGQEDVQTVVYCLTEPANVDITIVGDGGTVVRTIESAVSHSGNPSCYGYNYADWDGRSDSGTVVPDGVYEARLHAVNAEGRTADDVVAIEVDSRIPGALTAPSPNSTLSGTVSWTFTPSAGFAVSDVHVDCSGAALGSATIANADRTYSGSGDTTQCQAGENRLTTGVQWTDGLGARHWWTAPVVPVVVDNPPRVEIQPYSHRYFSPNGDSQEDSASVAYCLSKPAKVDVTVTDSAGAAVRTIESAASKYGHSVCAYGTNYAEWDGKTDAGQIVADGVYAVGVRAVDSSGQSGSASIEVGVDRRTPGSVASPVAGDVLAGSVTWRVVPTVGMNVYEVALYCAGSGGLGYSRAAAPDGAFTATADSTSCAAGRNDLVAQVHWTDPFGSSHGWTSPPTPVTVDNPPRVEINPYAHRYFSPDGDDQDDTVDFTFCLSKNAKVDITVTDSSGSSVRTVETQADRTGGVYCNWNLWSGWDGKNDSGAVVPGGVYTVRVRATDSSGQTGDATIEVGVETRPPGVLTAPAPNAALSGEVPWSFSPTTGFELTNVSVACAEAGMGSSGSPETNGKFTGTADTTRCASGANHVTATVQWIDPFGRGQSWTTPRVPVVMDNAPQVSVHHQTHRYFSPNGDDQEDVLDAYYCLSGNANVDVTVADGTGATVRTLEAATPKSGNPYCPGWNNHAEWDGRTDTGAMASDGAYTLRVRATTSSGHTGEASVEVGIDSRRPGSLVTPAPGTTLAGVARLAFQPTSGYPVTQVDTSFDTGGQASIFNPSADGLWRTSLLTGSLRNGPAVLHATVQSTDAFGVRHWWSATPTPVLIDVTSLPLTVSADPLSGPAPLATTLRVDTSDPQARAVHYVVNFGDGTPNVSGDAVSPYPTIEIPHTYTAPGVRRAIVTVTNSAGAASTSAVDITATGRPNTAPVAELALDRSSGTTPLVVNASIGGSDAEQDALSYSISFGDGTPPASGALPRGPVSHTYDVPGSFLVRLAVSDGQRTTVRTAVVVSALGEPHTANAGDDQRATTGDQVAFDGGASRPSAAISSYHWDFGDGATADGAAVTHTYSAPGEYTAWLTTKIGQDTATDTAKITVQAPPAEQGLIVHVSGSGGALPGAQALIVRPDGSRLSATTDGTGKAVLANVDDGSTTLYVWATGHRPQAVTTTVTGGRGEVSATLVVGEVGAATLDQRRLTYEEIIEKGIDVADPVNSHVYEANIHLYFEPGEPDSGRVLPFIVTPNGIECVGECGQPSEPGGGGGGGSGSCSPTSLLNPCFTVGEYQYLPRVTYVRNEPIIQWLVLPMRASFLKEFFDVKLIVQNLTGGFTFEHGVANLQLPGGLSLAPTPVPQSLSQSVDAVPGGESRTVSWVVRGDTEGKYPLSATYSGSVEPIGEPVYLTARSQSDVEVVGASKLRTTIKVDQDIVRWGPYHVDVEIHNESDVPVYNMQIEMFDRPENAPDDQALFDYAPGLNQVQGTGVIASRGTWTAEYVVFAGVGNEEVTRLHAVLGKSFVERTGGDVDLHPQFGFRDRPQGKPTSVHAIEMEVRQRGGVDNADLNWTRPQVADGVTVTGYELWTRQSLRGGVWKKRNDALSTDEVSIPSTERMEGRYYGVVTKLSDGTREYRHSVGVGPSRYVSLGDSFSAGEGVPQFESDTASDVSGYVGGNKCHRSFSSYARLLAADRSIPALLEPATFAACSGAIAKDFEESKPHSGERPQREQVSQFTDVITLSVGGNDIGFKDVATNCAITDCTLDVLAKMAIGGNGFLDRVGEVWDRIPANACVNPLTRQDEILCAYQLLQTITSAEDLLDLDADRVVSPRNLSNEKLRDRLTRVYNALLERAPNAQILVQSYPQVVKPDNIFLGRCDLFSVIGLPVSKLDSLEIRTVEYLTSELNRVIRETVESRHNSRIQLVDAQDYFEGHELCRDGSRNDDSYFHGLVAPDFSDPLKLGPLSYSLHPNAEGQKAYERAAADQLKKGVLDVFTVPSRGEVNAGAVYVAAGSRSLRASAAWPGSTVSLKLVSPQGTEYDRHTPGVRTGGDSTSRWLEVPNPGQGEWKVKLFGDDVNSAGEPTQVSAYAEVPPPPTPTAVAVSRPVDGVPGAFDFEARDANTAYVYEWTFSDGTVAHGATARHQFTGNGPMWASLRATDKAGESGWYGLDLGPAPTTPTSVALTSSSETAAYGDNLTLTATVTAGGPVPTGTATFSLDGSALPGCSDVPLANGAGTCATSMLAAGTHSITASYNGSAEFGRASATLTQRVDRAVLRVDARDATKPYGAESPPLAHDVVGFVNGDDKNVVVGTAPCVLAPEAPKNAGVHQNAITCGTNGLSALNYTFTPGRVGALTVTKVPLTVNANSASTTYGDTLPALTARLAGFVAGETASNGVVTGSALCTTTATATSPSGSHPITCTPGSLGAANYTFAAGASGTLVVAKRAVTVAYTGPASVSTGSATATSARSIDLRAQVTVAPGGTVDLTKASVVFRLYRSSNTTMDPAAPDLRCEATSTTAGVATCTVSTVAVDNWTVVASVPATNGHFVSADSDPAVLSVYQPIAGKYALGAGWVTDPGTDGKPVAVAANTRGTFGFIATTRLGLTLGQSVYSFRGVNGYNYVIKTDSFVGGSLTFGAKSIAFTSKCSVTVLDPKTGKRVTSLGMSNLSCRLDVTDNGDPGTRDTYAFTVKISTGATYHQVGTTAAPLPVKGGEVVVRVK